MVPALALRVPSDEQWGEGLVSAFYDYALEKRRRLQPDREWPSVEQMPGYVVALEYLGERPFVEEPVPERVHDAAADVLDEFFEGETVRGDELDQLAAALRGAADDDHAFDVETGPVAVCEFARERGYAVELRE